MGHGVARDEAVGAPWPTWFIERALDAKVWSEVDTQFVDAPVTGVERKLLHDLLHARRELEALRAQLDVVTGYT